MLLAVGWGRLAAHQLSHPYMTTGKTIAVTRRTFVGKVMSLLAINKKIKFKTVYF